MTSWACYGGIIALTFCVKVNVNHISLPVDFRI